MSSLLTTEYITDEVEDVLGSPIVEVEDIETSVARSINKCKRILQTHKPKILNHTINNVITDSSTAVYADFEDNVMGIYIVNFVKSASTGSTTDDPFTLFGSMVKGGSTVHAPSYDLSGYMMRLDRIAVTSDLFGSENDYKWIDNQKRLILHVPNGPKDVYIEYFAIYDNTTDVKLEDDQFFIDMVIAQMKMKVGNLRNKFGGNLPAPGNASIQLNGSDLYSQGQDEWRDLMDRLELMAISPPPQYD